MFYDMQIEFCFHFELLLALARPDTKCIFGKRSLLTQRRHENICWSLDLPTVRAKRPNEQQQQKNKIMVAYLQWLLTPHKQICFFLFILSTLS